MTRDRVTQKNLHVVRLFQLQPTLGEIYSRYIGQVRNVTGLGAGAGVGLDLASPIREAIGVSLPERVCQIQHASSVKSDPKD